MATKKAAKTANVVPNLFNKAADNSVRKPKKPVKGTVFEIPGTVPVGGDETEIVKLHEAVHKILEASREEKDAKNKAAISKGALKDFVETEYATEMVRVSNLPATPVQIINKDGESLTYIVQDKSKTNGLNEEQQEALVALIGNENYEEMTTNVNTFMFDPTIMNDIAGEIPASASMDDIAKLPRVCDVIGPAISKAIMESNLLSDDQKVGLIRAESKVLVRGEKLKQIPLYCRNDPNTIIEVLDALGSVLTRYLKS